MKGYNKIVPIEKKSEAQKPRNRKTTPIKYFDKPKIAHFFT